MKAAQDNVVQIPYLPSGKPAPTVLTADETIELLRLDGNNPERTLKYWRDTDQLVGIRIGRRTRYTLDEILRFLDQKVASSKNNGFVG